MPAKKTVECKCLNCDKLFLQSPVEIRRGGGKYCSKRCWSQKCNAPRIKADGVPRRRGERRKRVERVRRDPLDNSVLNPFGWLKKYDRGVGRPKDSNYTSYGRANIRSFSMPDNIYLAAESLAELKKVSVSQLVSGFVLAGIYRGKHGALLQRAYKYRRPVTAPDQRFGWTDQDIQQLDSLCIDDLLIEDPEVEDQIASVVQSYESSDDDDCNQE